MCLSYFVKNVFVQMFVFSFFDVSCNLTSVKGISAVIFEILKECLPRGIATYSKIYNALAVE